MKSNQSLEEQIQNALTTMPGAKQPQKPSISALSKDTFLKALTGKAQPSSSRAGLSERPTPE
jgi:hypothetical protein